MNKKIFYYILIGLGALDLIIWVLNGFSFGWLELIVGVNGLSKYGAWIMIATGIWLLKKEKAKEKSEIDAVADLETGEEIIFKNVGGKSSINTKAVKNLIGNIFPPETILEHILDECLEAGIKKIILVISNRKEVIKDYLSPDRYLLNSNQWAVVLLFVFYLS